MKKPTLKPGLILLCTLLTMAEFVIIIAAAIVAAYAFDLPLESVPATVWLWIAGVGMGGLLAFIANHYILSPIKRLSHAMDEVASGDFTVTAESGSHIREIRNLYDKFNIMTKELRSTEVLQSDFVSNVSHEIKTPITAIEGYTMLLQNPELSEEDRALFTDKILFNADKLSALVGNILLLSKLDNQAVDPKNKPFRLDEQIRQSIMLLEPQWTARDTVFDVDLDEVIYNGNEPLLLHVWNNLIGNAVKFSPDGGLVKLTLNADETAVFFVVEDNGPGIPEEQQTLVFQKFFQGDDSRKQEGSGLGLALVKRIVDMNDGDITVANRPSGGCRFTVRLPIRPVK